MDDETAGGADEGPAEEGAAVRGAILATYSVDVTVRAFPGANVVPLTNDLVKALVEAVIFEHYGAGVRANARVTRTDR